MSLIGKKFIVRNDYNDNSEGPWHSFFKGETVKVTNDVDHEGDVVAVNERGLEQFIALSELHPDPKEFFYLDDVPDGLIVKQTWGDYPLYVLKDGDIIFVNAAGAAGNPITAGWGWCAAQYFSPEGPFAEVIL